MIPVFAEVVFATWQALFLIILCFVSMGISLYCIFFMVPLRSFMKHINSLGGGMEGIRSHVDGVREEVEERIDALESSVSETFEQQEREIANSLEELTDLTGKASRRMDQMEERLDSLEEGLTEQKPKINRLRGELDNLGQQHADLRNDFDAIEDELQGRVRRAVEKAYNRLEGTLLGGLEALQDEMLRPDPRTESRNGRSRSIGPGQGTRGYRSGDTDGTPPDKIISAEPLFSENAGARECDDSKENDTGGEKPTEEE